MLTLTEILGESGPLAARVPGFRPRAAQQAMAEEVARALEERGVLLCEAGTGTGKTFAYLAPALASGRRVIVSTGTRNLQDQLFHRDLPLVREALATPARVTLLKGRANYLCLHRLALHASLPVAADDGLGSHLASIRDWSGATRTGDLAELAEVPETSPAWRLATSTSDNCLGSECPRYQDCFLLKARQLAQAADIVVVNHHLLFADMALRQEGFGELLPGAEAIIVDEAHQLPELATRAFGTSLASGQIAELARDAASAFETEAGDVPGFTDLTRTLLRCVDAVRDALAGAPGDDAGDARGRAAGNPSGRTGRRVAWDQIRAERQVEGAVADLDAALLELDAALVPLAERGRALRGVARRAEAARARLAVVTSTSDIEWVRWLELDRHGFRWHSSPLDVAETFRAWMASQSAAWVFTSATLAVGGTLAPFAERLGLGEARGRVWESPFDFAHQALVYLPPGLSDPRGEGYLDGVVAVCKDVLAASRGRAFVLFTSHHALARAAAALTDELDFPLLVQGSAPRDELLRRFRATLGAVLLGTASFWEGVDVRGPALACVIIDKLPFAPPDDPVNEARSRALRARGRDPFLEHHLPRAVIALKQGVGRLIRDGADRGVVVLCDPRLLTRSYGRVFLDSLPPIPVTRDLDEVRRFFAREAHSA